ncbi:MAG: hypothetical protein F4Z14_03310 [Gammaproteobacteria bacterium]|nr:hypothetical protein [Gammaproteobacteria bacterium]
MSDLNQRHAWRRCKTGDGTGFDGAAPSPPRPDLCLEEAVGQKGASVRTRKWSNGRPDNRDMPGVLQQQAT